MRYIPFLLAIFVSSTLFAQKSEESQVRAVLESQLKAWNEGNIEQFMSGYWNSDSLMFIGKSGITYGYQKTLENYQKNYPDKEKMGNLRFELLSVKQLSPGYFSVVGKWMLTRVAGNLGGHFSLLFRKIDDHWVIVSDHTS